MNILQSESQPQEQRGSVRNILVRHCGYKKVRIDRLGDKNYQHPENIHLVKYFPKYYKSLTLVMKPQHSLSSKLKKIKKLKRFSGKFNDKIPQVKWLKILVNNRKEIKELPQMALPQVNPLVWAKITLHAVRFFFNITGLELPTYPFEESSPHNFPVVWKLFSKHLRNMRRLKILEIYTDECFADEIDSNVLKELNRMPRLLENLEVLKCSLRSNTSKEIFFQNQKFLSYLTNLHYVSIPDEICQIRQIIPQVCKSLKSFSLKFDSSPRVDPSQFLDFITPIQNLPQLQSVSIDWAGSWSHDFWSYFIPPASLRSLKLKLNAYDMVKVIFKVTVDGLDFATLRNVKEYENFFAHWKEIKELDALDLNICCKYCDEILFTTSFITVLLKKIGRLTSFLCWTDLTYEGIWRFEPFFIKEVPHLYEHLKKLKVKFVFSEGSVSFDFAFLKPFKNAKEIDFEGSSFSWVNIWDAVCLLEENTKDGELSTLKLGEVIINYKEELNDLLKRISSVKNSKTNFKIMLALKFKRQFGDDEIMYLHQFCEVIESNIIKGLEISLNMKYQNYSNCSIEEVKGVLDKYPGLKNFVLLIYDHQHKLEFIKRDGEKEQLLFYP